MVARRSAPVAYLAELEAIAAQRDLLRKALVACRALHTGTEFMKGEHQKVLRHVDAVLVEVPK
jgi:hypothetical protein